MRKAIASFTIGTLLASFLAVPAAFAAGTPEWAMEGANAYLKAETRDQGYVLANKCEVATMIANALNLPMGDAEMQRGAEFQDLQGGMAWCQAAAGAVANTGIATGNGNMFGAAGSVSRAVVATMLVRAFQLDAAYQPASLSSERQAEFAGLEWAQEPMALGVAAGIIQGDAEGRLLPTEGASKWAVATMLHRAAGLDAEASEEATEEATEETTEEAPATPEVAPTGGALTVSLSDNSPSLANLGSEPNGGDDIDGVTIAAFELTAGSDDVRVNALRLHEIGGNGVFGPIALFDADGMRVSREKSFNNDNEANVSLLNGGLTIPAGKSVELFVRATIASNKGAATAALAIESPDDVSSNASSVSVSSATTELARLVQVNVERFTLKQGGSTPDVSVGDRNVQVARFDMEAGDEDMHLHALTLEQTGSINAESEMSNFRLEIEGQEVAATPYAVDDYVSFLLDTPYEIEEDDTAQARVFADILDGAGDDIIFSIESDLDLVVIDQAVQQPAAVYDFAAAGDQVLSDSFTTTTVTVEAGELTLVAHDAEFTEFGKNQSNLVLGYVDIESRSGESIDLQNINLKVTSTGGNIDDAMDVTTFEAVTSNGTYDLSRAGGCAAAADCTFSASNVDLSIKGVQRVWFRVDSKDNGFTEEVVITASLNSMDGSDDSDGLYFKEINDDTAITDITPTNITFEDITSKVSSATVRSRAQSSTLTSVQGTDGVKAMAFEIEAGEASHLEIDYLTFLGLFDANGGGVDNADFGSKLSSDHVDELRLYHTSVDEANLIQKQGGGELAAGLIEFDLKDFRIEASETTPFVLVVDLADNDNVSDDTIRVAVAKGLIRDMERDTVTLKNNDGETIDGTVFDQTKSELSRRTITFAANGTFTSTIDNSDSRADKNMYVLAGNTAIVGSVEIAAENEELTLKDFSIAFDGNTNALTDTQATQMLASVQLLDEELNELASSTVSGRIVNFDNKEIVIPVGTQNVYVQVSTNAIGKDLAGIESPANDLTFRANFNELRGQKLLSSYQLLNGEVAILKVEADAESTITINGEATTTAAQGSDNGTAAQLVADINANANVNAVVTAADDNAGDEFLKITADTDVTTITTNANVTTRYSAANSALRSEAATAGTTNSNQFGIIPVQITSASLGTELSTVLNNNTKAAVLTLENAATNSTQSGNTNPLKTQVEELTFNVDRFSGTLVRELELQRQGKTGTVKGYNYTIGSNGGGADTFVVNCAAAVANNTSCIVGLLGQTFSGANGAAIEAAINAAGLDLTAADAANVVTVTNDLGADRKLWIGTGNSDTVIESHGQAAVISQSTVKFIPTDLSSDGGVIDSGETAVFEVKANVVVDTNADTQDSLTLSMDDLSSGNIKYSDDNAGTTVTDMRLNDTDLDGTSIQ